VMGASFNEQSDAGAIGSDIIVKTTGHPRIKITVGENDVGQSKEVLVDIMATEVIESPVILRSETVLFLAVSSVGIIVNRSWNKHGFIVQGSGLEKLIASQNVPTITIKVTDTLCVTQVGARILTSVVEVNVCGVAESIQEIAFTSSHTTVDLSKLILEFVLNLFKESLFTSQTD